MSNSATQTVLIQLNEINFDVVSHYVDKGYDLSFLKKILDNRYITFEDEIYENLEPWIQWYTVYTGKPYAEHKIFRLGEGHISNDRTLFTDISDAGLTVGAIAPMNLSKKCAPFSFFLPDPWSHENPIGGRGINYIFDAVHQGVNDNSGSGISNSNKIKLLVGLLIHLKISDIFSLSKFFAKISGFSYRKALFLDSVLIKLHQALIRSHGTKFSSVFLNAGAHIQHHYFLNSSFVEPQTSVANPSWYISSELDPVLESLLFYEEVLKSYEHEGYNMIVATGLQQLPYLKNTYYYRLDDHQAFLDFLDIKYREVHPRMTRDFEVFFDNKKDKQHATEVLAAIHDESGKSIFGEIDGTVDGRLFCTLTYDTEIKEEHAFYFTTKKFNLFKFVNFVAVKNGEHNKFGTLYFSNREGLDMSERHIPLHEVNKKIVDNILK